MNKYEFVTNLQRHLTGKVTPEKLREITQYYNDYIDSEIRKGKSEEEVLEMLGDPRLLAKSIAETEGRVGGGYAAGSGAYEDAPGTSADAKRRKVQLDVRAFVTLLVILLLLLVILSAAFGIIGFMLKIFVRYVLPVAIPVALICWLIRALRR